MKGTELMDRIRDEMVAAKNDYISTMGELMTEYLRIHPETEIDDKKNLKGAFDALYSAANKKMQKVMYGQEVFDRMMDYFGLPHALSDYRICMRAMIGQTSEDTPAAVMSGRAVSEICEAAARRQENSKPAKNDLDDLLDLDALLGG